MPQRARKIFAAAARGHARGVEEVSIGAFARRQRLRRIAGGVCGGALILVATGLYWNLRPRAEFGMGSSYPGRVRCTGCGFDGTVNIAAGQGPPLVCPNCRARSAWVVWYCQDCRAEFVPDANNPRPGGPNATRRVDFTAQALCPKCHGARVGTAATR